MYIIIIFLLYCYYNSISTWINRQITERTMKFTYGILQKVAFQIGGGKVDY